MSRLLTPPRPQLRWKHSTSDNVVALAWSPDGASLAAASVDGPIAILDVNSGSVKQQLSGHGFGTTAIGWAGQTLASTGQDGKVRLWDVTTGAQRAEMPGGSAWVEQLAWSPKGDFFATAAGKKLRLWAADGAAVKSFPDAASTVAGIAWSPRGREFVTAGYGGITFYRPDGEGPMASFEWKGALLSVAWSPDGKMLAGGAQDSSVHFWFIKSGEDLQMSGYPTKVRDIAWSPSSQYLATGGGEVLVVWDCSGDGPAESKPLMFELHERPLTAVVYQHRGPVVATGCGNGRLGLFAPGSSKKVVATSELGVGISSLSWSPGDGRLAVGGEDGTVAMLTV